MSKRKQENVSVSDIVAEMRDTCHNPTLGIKTDREKRLEKFLKDIIIEYADRIEAAEKRERESTHEKSSVVGNAAAMREALSDACYAMHNFLKTKYGGFDEMAKALDKAKFALSAPPRNCDVGTPKEQSARFDAHCRKHMGCLTCPLREKDGGVPKHCEFEWSQMPYEEVK